MGTITRVFEFDAAHRIMNERVKCFNLHGHRFKVEATFEYFTKGSLGYALDFKELKRIIGDWIDEYLDHSCILNPMDKELIEFCRNNNWRIYVMGMGYDGDVNPSAENLASELLYVFNQLFIYDRSKVKLSKIRLYETPNCWVETDSSSYVANDSFLKSIHMWRHDKGDFCYDIREVKNASKKK